MNLEELSNVLTKVYNTVGNRYIIENYTVGPFEFKVKVRYGNPQEYHDYYAEVYSVPEIPEYFRYKPEVRKEKNMNAVEVNSIIVELEFKKMISYIDPKRSSKFGVNFMNVKK